MLTPDIYLMEEIDMFLQQGDKDILANVGKTVLILVGFMFAVMIAANILA